jgi:hypothetical protein
MLTLTLSLSSPSKVNKAYPEMAVSPEALLTKTFKGTEAVEPNAFQRRKQEGTEYNWIGLAS